MHAYVGESRQEAQSLELSVVRIVTVLSQMVEAIKQANDTSYRARKSIHTDGVATSAEMDGGRLVSVVTAPCHSANLALSISSLRADAASCCFIQWSISPRLLILMEQ